MYILINLWIKPVFRIAFYLGILESIINKHVGMHSERERERGGRERRRGERESAREREREREIPFAKYLWALYYRKFLDSVALHNYTRKTRCSPPLRKYGHLTLHRKHLYKNENRWDTAANQYCSPSVTMGATSTQYLTVHYVSVDWWNREIDS